MTIASASQSIETNNEEKRRPDTQPTLNAEDVAAWLHDNPDFFAERAELLADLALPHHSGTAVSLVERQVAILRERSIATRHRLGEMLEAARTNDELFNKTQALVLKLLDADSLPVLFDNLHDYLRDAFQIPIVSVFLLSDDTNRSIDTSKSLSDAQQHIGSLLDNERALCGILRDSESTFIFGDNAPLPGSAAVACRKISSCDSIVVLAVAHSDPEHYNSDTGTLFLDYLCDTLEKLASRLIR